MQGGKVEKFHLPQGANGRAQDGPVDTFTTLRWQGDHVGKGVYAGVDVELVE